MDVATSKEAALTLVLSQALCTQLSSDAQETAVEHTGVSQHRLIQTLIQTLILGPKQQGSSPNRRLWQATGICIDMDRAIEM